MEERNKVLLKKQQWLELKKSMKDFRYKERRIKKRISHEEQITTVLDSITNYRFL